MTAAREPAPRSWPSSGTARACARRRGLRARAVSDTAGVEQVVVPGGRVPALSADGRWLAYVSSEAGKSEIWVLHGPDSLRAVADFHRYRIEVALARWSRDGRELLFIGTDSVWAVAVTGSATFTMGARSGLVASDPFVGDFDVYPNGDLLMLRSRPGGGATELTMIEDRRSALVRDRE